MPDKDLVHFIKEARLRGFDDIKIEEALLSNGWQVDTVEDAFASLKIPVKFKNKICIYLDPEILKKINARAKRNLFTISEQIEDILRRSVVNTKKTFKPEKLDDMLVALFSRRRK